MTHAIDKLLEEERAFVRVYCLPGQLTNGYCFGAGNPITFMNVDWFEAPIGIEREELLRFIKGKRYYRPDQRFLLLGDHPSLTFTIDADPARPVLAEEREP